MPDFARKLILWQRRHGRRGLPWQGTRDPYRIWLSEIMLQQTQVAAVVPYYERFLARFPDVVALAGASEQEVLRLWSGLGYYARGRNLLRAARQVHRDGRFPDTKEAILALPGVGRSTAAAIAVFAFGRRAAILDGNVKRVLARCFGVEGAKPQWDLAERLLPATRLEAYTQGLMDLGATVCTRSNPACERCPVARMCVARRDDRIRELPAPRKKKPRPTRKATWFVLLHAGSVLLERRPGTGVWGGLWTFPEFPAGTGAAAATGKSFFRSKFACEVSELRRLPPVEHGFTHFKLRAQPIRCNVQRIFTSARLPVRLWLDIEEAAHAAVPAPVRKLLLGLA